MNRKERRAAEKRGKFPVPTAAGERPGTSGIADLIAEARRQYQQGHYRQAQDICLRILASEPAHLHSLNLLGLMEQGADRHTAAVKLFAKALAADEFNAACHYNIASSYQALNRRDDAEMHFRTAIALGMSDKNVEEFIIQNPAVATYLERLGYNWRLPPENGPVSAPPDLTAVARDIFLRCALEWTTVRGAPLEVMLTDLRAALLRLAAASILESRAVDDDIAGLFCALARQMFINEYIFARGDEETCQAGVLRELLLQNLAGGHAIPPLLLASVAAYWPLHSLPVAKQLSSMPWPESVEGLVRQQLREPLEEMSDRAVIPALTAIEDGVSRRLMQQYEENPYPRWTINPMGGLADDRKLQAEVAAKSEQPGAREILIAGCGTGKHAFQTALLFPEARVLAVDISRSSLAYARRKTREEGLHNVEYMQADILKLGTIGRSFDRIECVGVLHHLGDPLAGWRVLLSLLRPGGDMRIGLYSEAARRTIVDARALIAERGYRPTAEDIRKCRQEILRERDQRRWKMVTLATDFYSMSGCRDLLFNIVEHRFAIHQIKEFLDEQGLSFLGFDLDPVTLNRFRRLFPGAALADLDRWHIYEEANPQTFQNMYVFSVRKRALK